MSNSLSNRSLKMHGRVRWLFFFAVVALVSFGGVLYQQQKNLSETRYWVDHTYLLISEVAELKSSLAQAESATRNFLLSNDSAWERHILNIHTRSHQLLQTIEKIQPKNISDERKVVLQPLIDFVQQKTNSNLTLLILSVLN